MCPACIGAALYALTGAGSAGGVVLIAWKTLRRQPRDTAADSNEEEKPDLVSVHVERKTRDG